MNSNEVPLTIYPISAFYADPVADAVNEVMRNTQAPAGLVGMEFLSNMFVAAQGLYDVKLPFGAVSPLSSIIITINESGERSSPVRKHVAGPLDEFDAERERTYQAQLKRYEAEHVTWNAIATGLRRALTKAAKDGETTTELQAELTACIEREPEKPRQRRFVRQNMSEVAIMEALEGDGESIAVKSDEGQTIVDSPIFKSLGLLNKFWDGTAELTRQRGNGRNIIVQNPRVSVSFKAHPRIFEELNDRRSGLMRSTGNWARCLIGCPGSTQGTRFTYSLEQEWKKLPKFHARMRWLLEEYDRRVVSGHIERELLEFTEDAKRKWVIYSNQIEHMLQPTGYLHDVKDFASKAMEIACRVAAVLHVFSGQVGQISAESLERAMKIIEWHMHEFKRIFAPHANVDRVQVDVQTLGQFLYRRYWCNGVSIVAKNEVLKSGPLRPSERFEAALARLVLLNHVWIQVGPKRQRLLVLNPDAFATENAVA